MPRLTPRRAPIARSELFVAALLVATLLISGCAVTGPDRNGSATVNNSPACQGRSGDYHQHEIEVHCPETAVRSRDGTARFLSERAKTALLSAGLLALLYALSDDDDNEGSCFYLYYPIPCDRP